jgi:hypothetical protein
MDMRVEIVAAPKIPFADFDAALTDDALRNTTVACKSGASWREKLLEDATKSKPLEVVAEGGHFMGMVNLKLAPSEAEDIRTDIVKQISKKLGLPEDEIDTRVRLYDANSLARFYAYNPVVLSRDLRDAFHLPLLNGLFDYPEWLVFQGKQRGWPEFAADGLRKDALDDLNLILNRPGGQKGQPEVVWVYGPPGTGKSRLVAEALAIDATVSHRAVISQDYDSGDRIIRATDLPRYAGAILVVDECPPGQVATLAASFHARGAGQHSTLILIGPQEGKSPPPDFDGRSLHIEPLQEGAARRLVEAELGGASGVRSELVERVLFLTQGYPWFAVLLARALRDDPDALSETADHWAAARVAIAGTARDYGNDSAAWNREINLRANALMLVLMTEGVDWDGFSVDTREAIERAFEHSWNELRHAAIRCFERGLLRVRQNWRYKYVTPNNLARLVASHLLAPPVSIGTRLRTEVPGFREDLYRRLEALDVPDHLLGSIAEEELRPFEPRSLDELSSLPLQFLARHQPGLTAHTLRRLIESTDLETLHQRRDIRRDLVFALNHVCRRKDGFEDAEAALFRLALAENESWSNNATGIWTDLFLGPLSLTHRSFQARLQLLEDRLEDPDGERRRLALRGLKKAVGPDFAGPMFSDADKVDGPWMTETLTAIREGKLRAWETLLRAAEYPDISAEAKATVVENLRATLRWGIGAEVLSRVAESAETWNDREKANLRSTLKDIRNFDSDILTANEPFSSALERLAAVVEPRDYHAKVLDIVGNWFPGDRPVDGDGNYEDVERQLDEALATEGLRPPETPIVVELEWLDSETAVRSVQFMFRVGAIDAEEVLLEPLLTRAREGGALNTLSAYLAGRSKVLDQAAVDSLLNQMGQDDRLAQHLLLTIWRVGASPKRSGWIVEGLKRGRMQPDHVGCLALGSWGVGMPPLPMLRLVRTLSSFPTITPRITALDLLLDQSRNFDKHPKLIDELENLVVSLAPQRLSGMVAHVWERACLLLIARGRIKPAIQAAAEAIRASEHYGESEEAWRVIDEAIKVDPILVWNQLAPLLDQPPERGYRISLEMRGPQIVNAVPPDIVMRWIAGDEWRSILVAEMCDVYSVPLSALARELIIAFGAQSPAARELAARAHSTPGVVNSLAAFHKSQLENARLWAEDSNQAVSDWAKELARDMEALYESEAAREEFEERQRR